MSSRIEQLQSLLAEDASDPFLHYALAMEHMATKDYDKAIEILKSLRASHSSYLALYYQLGKCYEEFERIDEALEAYRSGEHLANAEKDMKTLGELREAIWYLED